MHLNSHELLPIVQYLYYFHFLCCKQYSSGHSLVLGKYSQLPENPSLASSQNSALLFYVYRSPVL